MAALLLNLRGRKRYQLPSLLLYSRERGDGHLMSSFASQGDGGMAIPLPIQGKETSYSKKRRKERRTATSILTVLP